MTRAYIARSNIRADIMIILTWTPEHLDDVDDVSRGSQERTVKVKVEHPHGQAKTVTLGLGLRSVGNSKFRWFVNLKEIDGKTHTDRSTFEELIVCFKVCTTVICTVLYCTNKH